MKISTFLATAALGLGAMSMQAEETSSTMSAIFGYCSDPATAVYFKGDSNYTTGAAMELDADAIADFAGCKVTSIFIANGLYQGSENLTEVPITVFVANSLTADSIATYETTMDLTNPWEYKEFVLPEPVQITEGSTSLFFGFKVQEAPKFYPLVVDYNDATLPGDYLGTDAEGEFAWARFGSQCGQACIRLRIEGESFGNMNKVGIASAVVPAYAKPGEEMEVKITCSNLAYNPVNSVTVNYTVNNGETQSKVVEFSEPLNYNSTLTQSLVIDAPTEEGASLPIKLEITGINAENAENGAAYVNRVKSSTFHCFTEGFEKNMVAEFVTGTWCGYCPQGHYAADKLSEYDEAGRFIPISVHYGDAMAATSYQGLYSSVGGAPYVQVNRNTGAYGTKVPNYNTLKTIYDYETSIPALVNPRVESMTYNASTKKLNVEASVEFATATTGEYAFAFVVLEDKVGPYDQSNYYAGAAGTLEWWDEQGSSVSMEFDNVARYIYSYNGVMNSIPETVEAGTKYTYTAAVATNTVTNIKNTNLVLMVINRGTSMIENAVKVAYGTDSAIESVEAELNGEAPVYFDLQGRVVATPVEGKIYIERRGSETRKVLF